MREFWDDFKQYVTPANTIMMLVIIGVYIVQVIADGRTDEGFTDALALEWWRIFDDHEYYRLITYCFLHGSLEHIINNMIVLAFVGSTIERLVGSFKYLISYLGCGVVAGLASAVYNRMMFTGAGFGEYIISIGASGAIFGMAGMLLGVTVMCRGQVRGITMQQVVIFLCISIYSGLRETGIDNMAHIAGALFGIISAFILFRAEGYNEG